MSNLVQDVLAGYTGSQKQASAFTGMETDPIKLASEMGAQEADRITKIASYMGEIMGQSASRAFCEALGYEPGVLKEASLQDVMADAMYKAAAQVSGNTAQSAISAAEAGTLQATESAVHHAEMAARSAIDAVQAADQGDGHTAGQQLQSSHAFLEQAKAHAADAADLDVHDQIAEVEQIVAQATQHVAGGAM